MKGQGVIKPMPKPVEGHLGCAQRQAMRFQPVRRGHSCPLPSPVAASRPLCAPPYG